MKPRLSQNRTAAMSLFEVGVVVAVVMILAAVLLPELAVVKRKSSRINCVNNLKQVGLSYRLWDGAAAANYPMGVSLTSGGSMEMVATGDVVQTYLVMSNQLSRPVMLLCPMDSARVYTASFAGLANSNLSYFVGVDVTNDDNPQMIISGDRNLQLGRRPVKPGLVSLWTNDPVAWTAELHTNYGNLGFADGSVMSATSANLRSYLQQTGLATNRFAIP